MTSAKDRRALLRVKAVVADLGLEKQKVFSVGELEKIAKAASVDMLYVMHYLRHCRV